MAQQALRQLLDFEDVQIVEGMVCGLNLDQRLRFLLLVEDAFGTTQAASPSATEDSGAEQSDYTFLTDLEPVPLAEPKPVHCPSRPWRVPATNLFVPPLIVLSVIPGNPPPKPQGAAPRCSPSPPTSTLQFSPRRLVEAGGQQLPPTADAVVTVRPAHDQAIRGQAS